MTHFFRFVLPVAILALVLAGCASLGWGDAPPTGSLVLKDANGNTADTFAPGDTIEMVFTVRNPSRQTIQFRFPSGQQTEFVARSASGATLWTWSASRSFMQANSELTIPPKGSVTIRETFSQRLDGGNHLHVGDYSITATLPGKPVSATAAFKVD